MVSGVCTGTSAIQYSDMNSGFEYNPTTFLDDSKLCGTSQHARGKGCHSEGLREIDTKIS